MTDKQYYKTISKFLHWDYGSFDIDVAIYNGVQIWRRYIHPYKEFNYNYTYVCSLYMENVYYDLASLLDYIDNGNKV